MCCKYCGTALGDGQLVCPSCNRTNKQESAEHIKKKEMDQKTMRRMAILITSALLALLLGTIAIFTFRKEPTATQMERVVVSCNDFALTNTELGYYFWSEYFYFIGVQGENLPATLDVQKPLADQMYDEETTWEDFVLARAVETIESTMAMVFQAEQAEFTLPEAYAQSLEQVLLDFEASALAVGQTDVEAHLMDSYGEGATQESFEEYMYDSYLAAAYSDELYYAPTFTVEEQEAYYDAHGGNYVDSGVVKSDEKLRTVLGVLIRPADPNDTASWATAEENAKTLYTTWQVEQGDATDFSAMAAAHSSDISSSGLGGLMANLRSEDLSPDMGAWVFDPLRVEGDTTVLQTDTGWMILYFQQETDTTYWQSVVEEDLRQDTYRNESDIIMGNYEFAVDYPLVRIATPTGLYEGTTEETAAEVAVSAER